MKLLIAPILGRGETLGGTDLLFDPLEDRPFRRKFRICTARGSFDQAGKKIRKIYRGTEVEIEKRRKLSRRRVDPNIAPPLHTFLLKPIDFPVSER